MKFPAFIISLLFSLVLHAQVTIQTMEDSLLMLFEKTEAPEMDDAQKLAINQHFKTTLYNTLLLPSSFKHNFEKLKSIAIVKAPDKKFKIFTWAFATSDGIYHYYGFTQYHNKKNKSIVIRELKDKSDLKDEFSSYSDSLWYGAVYYEIVPVKKKNDSCYILLGWDGNNWMSKKRMIEAISFSNDGKITFGKKIFKENEVVTITTKKSDKPIGAIRKEKETVKGKEKQRIIFEYAAQASMSLHYNKELKMIVFDHLVPSDPAYINMYMFYAPDFSYDAYYYKNSTWYLSKNVDVRNTKTIKSQPYQPNNDENIKLKKPEFKRN